MIVTKYIGPVRIDGTIHRLKVGGVVPPEVMEHWKKNNAIESLKGFISDGPIRKSQTGQQKNPEHGVLGSDDRKKRGKSDDTGADNGTLDVSGDGL